MTLISGVVFAVALVFWAIAQVNMVSLTGALERAAGHLDVSSRRKFMNAYVLAGPRPEVIARLEARAGEVAAAARYRRGVLASMAGFVVTVFAGAVASMTLRGFSGS